MLESSHILVVHRESAIRRLIAESLGRDGFRVSLAGSGAEALSLLEQDRVAVLVTDSDQVGAGCELLRQAASIQPLLATVLFVDAAAVGNVPQPARGNQVHCLVKPVTMDALRSAIRKSFTAQAAHEPAGVLGNDAHPARGNGDAEHAAATTPIIAASKAMREIMAVIARCAPSDAPVLICGEPDTGKETVAREIHRRSRRAAGPFVRVPCGALREPELAQRLFGQAGSGLDRQNQPAATLLEKARGGTLFLENVSQLPLWSQDKLLDLVQGEQCSCDQPTMDVRVIASTGADLPAAVAARSFSSSLYYYLNVVQIQVPPLRSRPQDIGPLAEAILASAVAVRTRGSLRCPCRFSEDALQRMAEHDWPGNISQLAGAVTHAVLLADGEEITWSMLTESLGEVAPRHDGQNISVPLTGGLKEIERAVIEAVIERCRGNKAAAARMLRLHRRTLYRILQDDHHAKKGQVPMPLIVGPTVDACATNAVG